MQFTTKVQAALFGLCLSAASAVAAPGLSLSLSGGNSFAGVEDFKITTSLVNTGDAPLKLLKDPRTILSTLPTDSFTISNAEGASPQFTGAKVKYVPAAALKLENSVVELAPGESIEVQHDLSSAYNFTLPGAGSYDIRANTQFLYVDPATNEISEIEAAHEQSLTSSLTGNLVARPKTLTKRATYRSCSSSQQSQLASAQTAAINYANAAYSYASSHTSSTTRYVSWFGTYDSSRHSTIVSHYNSIKGYAFTGSTTYDCGCTDSAYAYVNLGEYGVIHLCQAFWPAPTTGTDSKGGTLIHESSHFTQIAGTDDVVYGQSGARSLAKSNPANAIRNADSHEYFAENNPAES